MRGERARERKVIEQSEEVDDRESLKTKSEGKWTLEK